MKFYQALFFCSFTFLAACGDDGSFSDLEFDNPRIPDDTTDGMGGIPDPAAATDRAAVDGPWLTQSPVTCETVFNFSNNGEVGILPGTEVIPTDFDVISDAVSQGFTFQDQGEDGSTLSLNLTPEQLDTLGEGCSDLAQGMFFVEFDGDTMSWFSSVENAEDDQADFVFDYIPFPEDIEDPNNTASLVVSISPASAEEGALTMFSVVLDYAVDTDATLAIGVNDEFRDLFIAQDTLTLSAGDSGQQTFNLSGTAFDWGPGADYAVLVTIRANEDFSILSSYSFPIAIDQP